MRCRGCGRGYVARLGCMSRFDSICPSCARRWRRRIFRKYYPAITRMKRPKLVTLTLRKVWGRERRLKKLWDMRKQLFRHLARHGVIIRSWVAVVEPPNHVHIVVDMGYVPKYRISEMWHKITGDSYIVDIRSLNLHRNPRGGAAYITKYLGKASCWEGINLDRLRGFHLIGSWGIGDVRKPFVCLSCGSLGALTIVSSYDFWAVMRPSKYGETLGDFGPT